MSEWAFSSKSLKYQKSQTVRARERKFWENVHPPQNVPCHLSLVTCHVSHVTCNVSQYFFICLFIYFDKLVTLIIKRKLSLLHCSLHLIIHTNNPTENLPSKYICKVYRTLHSAQNSVHYILQCRINSTDKVHSGPYIAQFGAYSSQNSVQCTVYSVQCTYST